MHPLTRRPFVCYCARSVHFLYRVYDSEDTIHKLKFTLPGTPWPHVRISLEATRFYGYKTMTVCFSSLVFFTSVNNSKYRADLYMTTPTALLSIYPRLVESAGLRKSCKINNLRC